MFFPGQITRPQSHPDVVPKVGASIRQHVAKNSTAQNPILENLKKKYKVSLNKKKKILFLDLLVQKLRLPNTVYQEGGFCE